MIVILLTVDHRAATLVVLSATLVVPVLVAAGMIRILELYGAPDAAMIGASVLTIIVGAYVIFVATIDSRFAN